MLSLSASRLKKKIVIYCQLIWGVGHFFRTLEICRALSEYDVILVTGGSRIDFPLPAHVRNIQLPAIMTDRDYAYLYTPEPGKSLEQVKAERQKRLWALFAEEQPDLLMVELFPFGRRAFRFELVPLLENIRNQTKDRCRVICSLRDILVEKKDPATYERRVLRLLNQYFDALLVHADPELVKLDETFANLGGIDIPLIYTGFITPPKPSVKTRQRLRQNLKLQSQDLLLVASAGGGKIGALILEPAIKAFKLLQSKLPGELHVFSGPFMHDKDFDRLQTLADDRIVIRRFSDRFLTYLAAGNLSISMGGYNTTMNLLATQIPALVWPSPKDREQRLRAQRLVGRSALTVLSEKDLSPQRLASRMQSKLRQKAVESVPIDLNGAQNTAKWISNWLNRL